MKLKLKLHITKLGSVYANLSIIIIIPKLLRHATIIIIVVRLLAKLVKLTINITLISAIVTPLKIRNKHAIILKHAATILKHS